MGWHPDPPRLWFSGPVSGRPDCRGNAGKGATCAGSPRGVTRAGFVPKVFRTHREFGPTNAVRPPRNRRRTIAVAVRHQEVRPDEDDPQGRVVRAGAGTGPDPAELRPPALQALRGHRRARESAGPGTVQGL